MPPRKQSAGRFSPPDSFPRPGDDSYLIQKTVHPLTSMLPFERLKGLALERLHKGINEFLRVDIAHAAVALPQILDVRLAPPTSRAGSMASLLPSNSTGTSRFSSHICRSNAGVTLTHRPSR